MTVVLLKSRFKDSKPLRSHVKYSTSSAWERRASLKISRAKLEDAGLFTCQAKNELGSAETSCRLTVSQAPTITMEMDKKSSSTITTVVGRPDKLSGRVGGRLVLRAYCEATPACESIVWFIDGKRADSEINSSLQGRVSILYQKPTIKRGMDGPIGQESYLTVSELQLSDAVDYGVTAVNDAGSAEAVIHLSLTDRPQPPLSVNVNSTRGTDWIEIVWERSPSDGGSKLTGYVIERRIVAGLEGSAVRETDWTAVGQTGPYDNRLRLRDCIPNSVYSFRVSATNDVGVSEPTEIESPYQLTSLTGDYLTMYSDFTNFCFGYA
jgi:hypothetical protein